MAGITIEIIQDVNLTSLPVTDVPGPSYGELDVYYPGISEWQEILLTNTTGGPLTPILSFHETIKDKKWWKTLRIYTNNDTLIPPDTDDTMWTGVIGAGATQTLFVRSLCTKEDFSYKYTADHWTLTGFTILNIDRLNDSYLTSGAINANAAGIGSFITLDSATIYSPLGEEFSRLKISVNGVVNMMFLIQYSDDNINWTDARDFAADLSTVGTVATGFQGTFGWDYTGVHRYWRIYKTNGVVAGNVITEVQWLLFEAHLDAYNFGVYGDHNATLRDDNGYLEDYEWRTSVQINTDTCHRINFNKPNGKVGKYTKTSMRNFEKYGHTYTLYYTPTIPLTQVAPEAAYTATWALESRCWDIKAIISSQRRDTGTIYNEVTGQLVGIDYKWGNRSVLFQPYGPDFVGWYTLNYAHDKNFGHSFRLIDGDARYRVDDPTPVYVNDQIVAFTSKIILESITQVDGADLILERPEFICQQNEAINSSELVLTRPNGGDGASPGGNIKRYDWIDPASANFVTPTSVWRERLNAGGNLTRVNSLNCIGWLDINGAGGASQVIWRNIVQVYYDEDCLIPVAIEGYSVDVDTNIVTLNTLGGTITTDGHSQTTPSKLYVKYVPLTP